MANATEADILNALRGVMDPELHRSLVELGMVRDLVVKEGRVEFTLALTIPDCPLRDQLTEDARKAVKQVHGVKNVIVTLGAMSEQERAAVLGQGGQIPKATTPPFNHIGRVIAIASGKGGVGKSSVTALLAVALARANYRVGILDADVTGPSIPRLFGLHGTPGMSVMGILPPKTGLGIKVVSINLLLPSEDEAVIWRGPIVGKVIEQFWNEVVWGDLDYLLVDLPPGTSDAPLTVMQSLPLDGMVLVTTPQELAAMIVRKARRMADQMSTPILGIVENMTAFVCSTCGTRHELFGPSHADEIADAPLLAHLPIAAELAALGDAGRIEEVSLPELDAAVEMLTQLKPAAVPAATA
ncbi:MAG: Mrp/NBP35 family ATP-binding protein [Chloroflexi bacterium]|nr:Mrp/NBP35 family ATP-binding protein [Chloroflexota bacterium]